MKLEGTLDAFSLPDIFSLLSMTKKTGGLHLQRSGSHGAVWFADGMLTGGASDLSRQSLGRRIAGSGRVTDAALTAAVTQVRLDADAGVASVLRDADAIDEGDLHSLVTEQIMDAVFDLMRWTDGSFAFVVDEPNRDGVGVNCRVDDVVAEARRRLDQWATIDPAVADQDTVLTITCDPPAEPQLSADEWSILALVDGQRSVGEIVDLCGRGEYAVVVTLADLVARKLLETEDGGVTALTRRQELFSAIEAPVTTGPVAVPAQPAPATPAPPPPATFPAEPIPAPYVPPTPVQPVYETPAPPPTPPAPAPAPAAPAPRPVVPHRDPGPFTSVPQPQPAEVFTAASANGAAGTPAAIERDPNVNKSLLLRLIAGVRGL
ncbi:MAG TPA: DUF4388 domain-containing protein [Mycobacteriales bacterium]|nr:DUF4388 domain-containing protein [Mycobacteriales bacterium]HWA68170.1 DUF4388 domain-containing protein [Mycobacteriales bacterium]